MRLKKMKIEIEYIKNLQVYPPLIKDIIREIGVLGKEFKEIRIWYGDSFDWSIFGDDESKLYFKETYLVEEQGHSKAIFVPYDKIFEIIIDYGEPGE